MDEHDGAYRPAGEGPSAAEGEPTEELPVTVARRPRKPVVLLTATVTVLASVGAWAALRDVAARLDAPRAGASSPPPVFDPGLASAFSPGPRLGDLRGILEQAPDPEEAIAAQAAPSTEAEEAAGVVAPGPATSQSNRFSGDQGSFGSTQGQVWWDTGSGGSERPSGGGSSRPSDGSQLCGMPAMC